MPCIILAITEKECNFTRFFNVYNYGTQLRKLQIPRSLRQESKVGSWSFLALHINFCPGWKAYFTSRSEGNKNELRTKYNFTKY